MPEKKADGRPRKGKHEEPKVVVSYAGDDEALKTALKILMRPRGGIRADEPAAGGD